MRADFVARLRAKGVTVDSTLLAAGGSELDRIIGTRITSIAWGDSTVRRKYLSDDNQLQKAIDVLKTAPNQQALFAIAARTQGVAVR
jgi:hypothetical protein